VINFFFGFYGNFKVFSLAVGYSSLTVMLIFPVKFNEGDAEEKFCPMNSMAIRFVLFSRTKRLQEN